MKPSTAAQSLRTLITVRRPAFLWGPPGIGKSDLVREAANDLSLDLIDVRAILLDPVDLRGLPRIGEDGATTWSPPDFLPRDGQGLLFLDELNAAPQLVQAACYQLVLDRRLGAYELPDGWAVLAAGNRETDRAVTARMPSALANRFVHIEVQADLDDWRRWALGNGIRPEIIAFLAFRPELLHAFDPDSKAFPSPRSWAFASDILNAGPDAALEYGLLAGAVGEGPATELMGFLKVFRSLPSPDAILLSPDTAHVPDDPATLYALSGALARKARPENFTALSAYAQRLPDQFSVLLIKDAIERAPECQQTRAFIEWASERGTVLS